MTTKLQTGCKKEGKERKIVSEKEGCIGVISSILRGENLKEMRKMIKGGEITGIKRAKAFRNGGKVDGMSVLHEFKSNSLPETVVVEYMSFSVHVYVFPPFRCYKSEVWSHSQCVQRKSEMWRRTNGECGSNQVKCCTCGGACTAAYGGCTVRKQRKEFLV